MVKVTKKLWCFVIDLYFQVLKATSLQPELSFYRFTTSTDAILTQYQHPNKAMYSCSSYGPTFGGYFGKRDMYSANDPANRQTAFSYCGSTYSLLPGNSVGYCAFFAGGSNIAPTDIELLIMKILCLLACSTAGSRSAVTIENAGRQ